MIFKRKKITSLPVIIFFVMIVLLVGSAVAAYRWVRSFTPEDILGIVDQPLVQNLIQQQVGEDAVSLVSLLPDLAGINEPTTYLLLFLNNTELRPGGGFIGVYGVVTVDNGSVTVHKVEGTEVLDNAADVSQLPPPPDIFLTTLFVDYWYFRDSNWSPDFVVNAQKALELFALEDGVFADDIDVVVGISATVLEQVLEETGPITVDGFTFTKENAVEKLQYEVNYGFVDRGIAMIDRKDIIRPFFQQILDKIQPKLFSNFGEYVQIGTRMVDQKHILAYAKDSKLQEKFEEAGLTGEVQNPPGDSLLWVDANLAALKTDHALNRNLSYTMQPTDDGRYEVTATMTYEHTGTFDWRTSRYLSYTRLYVPFGSELVSTGGSLGAQSNTDIGLDLGKTWFGNQIRVEPGTTETLSFTYRLPASIRTQAEAGLYTLFVQKQLGTVDHTLTLDLDFGTTILSATPAENQEEWYDTWYRVDSDLTVDREFTVSF